MAQVVLSMVLQYLVGPFEKIFVNQLGFMKQLREKDENESIELSIRVNRNQESLAATKDEDYEDKQRDGEDIAALGKQPEVRNYRIGIAPASISLGNTDNRNVIEMLGLENAVQPPIEEANIPIEQEENLNIPQADIAEAGSIQLASPNDDKVKRSKKDQYTNFVKTIEVFIAILISVTAAYYIMYHFFFTSNHF
ncbi:hypothetical protein GWI33_017420 [Rhynchophorus ferrugineus]|uniref:Uncharacterized protein n=1 Tax=Rhynchophorus ferrugineus TaxID=354439 RepID=A0A834HW10_RHYFE|nr:hypothetical protein GWI33_017420 [Rhynchophorus ferrugineus]